MTLEGEIANLKAVAQDYAARFERIDNLVWPNGARIAVNFTADFDAMLLRRLHNEPPMQLAKGEFGGRVGVWRLIELFDSHGIKATIFTPGRICELYPRALDAAVTERARACRPHVGAPRAEGPGARARPSAQDRRRARKDQRPPAGWHAQPPHARRLLERKATSTTPTTRRIIGPTTCWTARRSMPPRTAIPFRHR